MSKNETPKQVSGREIRPGDFIVEQPYGDDFLWEDELFNGEGGWNVELHANCNVDEVFGTFVETDENDDYLNIYADLRPWLNEIAPKLDVTLCKADGTDEYMERPLSENEQLVILKAIQDALPNFVTELQLETKRALNRLEGSKC